MSAHEYGAARREEADQLMPEEITKSIKEIPRDPEVVDLLKKISGGGPLPPR